MSTQVFSYPGWSDQTSGAHSCWELYIKLICKRWKLSQSSMKTSRRNKCHDHWKRTVYSAHTKNSSCRSIQTLYWHFLLLFFNFLCLQIVHLLGLRLTNRPFSQLMLWHVRRKSTAVIHNINDGWNPGSFSSLQLHMHAHCAGLLGRLNEVEP